MKYTYKVIPLIRAAAAMLIFLIVTLTLKTRLNSWKKNTLILVFIVLILLLHALKMIL